MKKASLLTMLAVALFTACQSYPPVNGNANLNQNQSQNRNGTANVNVNANANVNPGLTPTRSTEDRAVTVIVYYDEKTDKPTMVIAPPVIKLLKAKDQRLRVHVFNNLDVDIKELVIKFKTVDPLEGGPDDLKVMDIAAGDDKVGKTRKIKPTAADGVYKYGADAFGADGAKLASVDPEVVINQGIE